MNRDLRRLEDHQFDVLVIGGGVAGACAAWDAAQRGLAAALIERDDFAAGNSANSLKIIHGGLRHLQRLQFHRVRQAARERSTWLRIASHLVEPLPVLLPIYDRGLQRAGILRVGAALNDLITWDRNRDLAADRVLPDARLLSPRQCLELAPELEVRAPTAGLLFYDAQMYNSERLVLELVQAAYAAGAVVANHLEARGPLLHQGRLTGVVARDRLHDGPLTIRARVVINATGAAVADVTRWVLDATTAPNLRHSVALNLVTNSLGHRVAIGLPTADGGTKGVGRDGQRQLFLVPWRGRSLIGTAHLEPDGDPADPRAHARYVARFLEQVNAAWSGHPLSEHDIVAVHHGLVPLGPRATAAHHLLTWHRIIDHRGDGRPEVISVVSAKFTTGRLAAEEAVDLAVAKLGRSATAARTAQTRLPGALDHPVAATLAAARRRYEGSVGAEVLEHLVRTYGQRHGEVMDRIQARPELAQPVRPDAPVLAAQLVHGVEAEMARTVEDLVWRRTELGPRGLLSEPVIACARDALQDLASQPA